MDFSNKDILHIKDGNVEYLKFRILEKYENKINHIITLKHGGVSKNDLASLNFRTIGKDSKSNNLTNLEIICNKIGFKPENVHKACQNHTDNILILDSKNKEEYKYNMFNEEFYDGYITNEKNIATLVTTADCNPIIIYDPNKNVIANIHSGWKGTIKQIYLKAIKIMVEKFSCNLDDMIFCIGPSIRKCCFTTEDNEFKNNFTNIWKNEDEYIFFDKEAKKYHIDLPFVIKQDVLKIGLKEENIVVCNICTMCHSEDFYSYRRSLQQHFEDYGTFATIAYLR
jgi:hypothetical protein